MTDLVHQLQAELELAAVKRRCDLTKVAGSKAVADTAVIGITLELSVIPGVKGISAELQLEPFGEGEELLQREVEVVATRTTNGIERCVAIAVRARAAHGASWC